MTLTIRMTCTPMLVLPAGTSRGSDDAYILHGNKRTLEQIHIAPVKAAESVRLLGSSETVQWTVTPEGLSVSIPQSVRRSPPCEHAWALEIGRARVQ